jgi:hypothetical protein
MADVPESSSFSSPIILSDGNYIYSAVRLRRNYDEISEYVDIKFSMLNLKNLEERVLYRTDLALDTEVETRWSLPLLFVLYEQGIIYFLETIEQPTFFGIKFNLVKVDFNMEEVSIVYTSDILDSDDSFYTGYNTLNSFLIIYKDEESQKEYIVWDTIRSETYTKTYDYFVHGITYTYIVRPEADLQQYIAGLVPASYTDNNTYRLKGIDLYIFDPESESLVNYFEMWSYNDFKDNIYNEQKIARTVPSIVQYNNKIYACYFVSNDALLFFESYLVLGIYGIEEFPISCGLVAETVRAEWVQSLYMSEPDQFFLLMEISPLAGLATIKEIFNNRVYISSRNNYSSLPVWKANYSSCPPPETSYFGFYYADEEPFFIPGVNVGFSGPRETLNYRQYSDFHIPSFNNIEPVRMVFDSEEECLYIKVLNPNTEVVNIYEESRYGSWVFDESLLNTGLFKININNLDDYTLTMYDGINQNKIYDLTMTINNAYRIELTSYNELRIIRLSDNKTVADCGQYYLPDYLLLQGWLYSNEVPCKLSQQASTDELRIWKLIPYEDDSFKLIGYNLEGGASREIVMPAPFLFEDMYWFNVYQHDGKIIVVTANDAGRGVFYPTIGAWLIQ